MSKPDKGKVVVYVLECAGFYKVGLSTNFGKRLEQIQTNNPLPVKCVAFRYVPMRRRVEIERSVHAVLAEYRMHGEWFRTDIATIRAALEVVIRAAREKEPWVVWRGDCDARNPNLLATPMHRPYIASTIVDTNQGDASAG